MNTKFSLIVPLYNIEYELLEKCIESIQKQTYKNFECLIIDDCSDKKFKYEKYFKKIIAKDKRFKYFCNDVNKGLGETRNVGIKKSKGEYLLFIDSDDYVINETLEIIDSEIKKREVDYVMINFSKDEEASLVKKSEYLENEYSNNFLTNFKGIQSAWRFIVNRTFLISNNIFFLKDKRMHEDIYFVMLIKTIAKKFLIIDDKLYIYNTKRSNSLTNKGAKISNECAIYYIAATYDLLKDKKMFYVYIIYYMPFFISKELDKDLFNKCFDNNEFIKTEAPLFRMLRFFIKHNFFRYLLVFSLKNSLMQKLSKSLNKS